MTVLYITEYKTKRYAVTFQNNECVKVQNIEDISNHRNNIDCVKTLETFLGKIEVCDITAISGAFDKSVFDGNTILPKIGEECYKHRYVYIGGKMICSFLINDIINEYISNMGKKLTPYSIAVCDENIYFF